MKKYNLSTKQKQKQKARNKFTHCAQKQNTKDQTHKTTNTKTSQTQEQTEKTTTELNDTYCNVLKYVLYSNRYIFSPILLIALFSAIFAIISRPYIDFIFLPY